jgi:cell division septum initiation protein DivIVA
MTHSLTKADEIAAVRQLADELGPDSYLGPWLQDALPFLIDSLRSDIQPVTAHQLHEQATEDRLLGFVAKQKAQLEARELVDTARHQANELRQRAAAEADQITSRAWQAINLAMKELQA